MAHPRHPYELSIVLCLTMGLQYKEISAAFNVPHRTITNIKRRQGFEVAQRSKPTGLKTATWAQLHYPALVALVSQTEGTITTGYIAQTLGAGAPAAEVNQLIALAVKQGLLTHAGIVRVSNQYQSNWVRAQQPQTQAA